jgi:hypothetical protein
MKKISPYAILSKWLHDGSMESEIPKQLVDDKSIGCHYVLYYFQDSPYIQYISNTFNNYEIFKLDRLEIFKFIKQTIRLCHHKPRFISRVNAQKTKFEQLMFRRHPYLKRMEIRRLCEVIDSSENKDLIYESLGLTVTKKSKMTKKEKEGFKSKPVEAVPSDAISLDVFLLDFGIEEI